ncbi:MAG: SPASM domain-containing protein, partial [Magnetococcales bacterium]|nr:SPASM domain-containing protein [Magnetococcales bacterium]
DDRHALGSDAFLGYMKDIEFLAEDYIQCLDRFEKPIDYRLSSKILQLMTKSRRDFFCPAGERMFGVSVDGDVYPCSLHVGREAMRLGHVKDTISNDAVSTFRHRFGIYGQTQCIGCWNRHLCGGGCSAMTDRFGSDDCRVLMKESEAAIVVYHYFAENDPLKLLSLVSPATVRWAYGLNSDKP